MGHSRVHLAVAAISLVTVTACDTGFRSESISESVYTVESNQVGRLTLSYDTTPACGFCEVRFDHLAQFGSPADTLLPVRLPRTEQAPNGDVIVFVPKASGQEVIVYTTDGSQARIGGIGSGPGEYSAVSGLHVGSRRRIHVVHDQTRISIFDSRYAFLRQVVVPIRLSGGLIPLPDGRVVAVGGGPSRRLAGIPLHLIDSAGSVVRSFGSESLTRIRGTPERLVAVGRDVGTIWVAEQLNYRVELVDTGGSVIRTIALRPPDSWNTREILNIEQLDSIRRVAPRIDVNAAMSERPEYLPLPPRFELAGLRDDGNGHLWVAANVAIDGWERIPVSYGSGEAGMSDMSKQEVYRSVVDVIEISSGRLLGRGDLAGYAQLMANGNIARTSYAEDGYVMIEVFRVTFHQQ